VLGMIRRRVLFWAQREGPGAAGETRGQQ
jgi:hypothetical protein